MQELKADTLRLLDARLREKQQSILALDPESDRFLERSLAAQRSFQRLLQWRAGVLETNDRPSLERLRALDPESPTFEGDLYGAKHPEDQAKRAEIDKQSRERDALLERIAALDPLEAGFHETLLALGEQLDRFGSK